MKQLALGCALCALSLVASAGEHNWYVGIEGGLELETEVDEFAPALFGTVGAKLNEHFGLEGELGYRRSDEGYAEVDQFSAMFNVIYDVPIADCFTLSVGAGVGLADTTIEITDPFLAFYAGFTEASDTQIAAQVKLGAAYEIDASTAVVVNYRAGTVFENDFADFDNRSLTVGLRFAL